MFKSIVSRTLPTISSITKPQLLLKAPSPFIQSKMPLITISNSIKEGLKKNSIVPDVVDDFEPKGLLTISYGGSNEVALGNTLAVDETQTRPQFQFTFNQTTKDSSSPAEIKDTDLFTLVLTDPDAPSRSDHKWSEYAHFIHSNILLKNDSESSKDGDFFSTDLKLDATGSEILEYQGPAPPSGTGKHRYVFLLYKQPQGKDDLKPPSDRPNWGTGIPGSGVANWAKENNLELYAINFFNAENK